MPKIGTKTARFVQYKTSPIPKRGTENWAKQRGSCSILTQRVQMALTAVVPNKVIVRIVRINSQTGVPTRGHLDQGRNS